MTAYISCYLPNDKLQRLVVMLHVMKVNVFDGQQQCIARTEVSSKFVRDLCQTVVRAYQPVY